MISPLVRNRPGVLIFLLAVISTIPLWLPPLPPLTDLLAHLGRYRVQLDLATNPALQRFYLFEWALIPNLGVDLLVELLGPVLGLETAVKLIVIAIIGLTTTACLLLSRQVHGRIGAAALFALPLAYGFPFQFGFVNYCLSMTLALLAFALWLRLGAAGRIRLRGWLFVPISFIVWLSHISGWGAFGLFLFAAELVRQRQSGKSLLATVAGSLLICLPLALPLLLMASDGHVGSEGATAHWFQWHIKYQWFAMALSEHWQAFDIASVTILIILIGSALILSDLKLDPTLGLAALLLLIAFIFTPRILIGSAYADMRLVPYILALAVLSIDTRHPPRHLLNALLMGAGLLFFLVRTGATSYNFRNQSALLERELGALDHIKPGSRVVSFVTYECRARWRLERRTHVPSVALARKHIFTNDQFIMAGAQLIQIRYRGGFPFQRDPTQLVKPTGCPRPDLLTLHDSLKRFPRRGFDYVWLIGKPQNEAIDDTGLTLVWESGGSQLYRIIGS